MQIITSPFYYAQGSVTAQASLPPSSIAPVTSATPGDLLPKPSEVLAAAEKAGKVATSVASSIAGIPVNMTTLAMLAVPFMMYGLTGLLVAGGGLYLYKNQAK